jgi:cytochrome b561
MTLPALITENRDLGRLIKEIHEIVGTAGYYLVAIHTLAALFHHYILRDSTITRMLPSKKQ